MKLRDLNNLLEKDEFSGDRNYIKALEDDIKKKEAEAKKKKEKLDAQKKLKSDTAAASKLEANKILKKKINCNSSDDKSWVEKNKKCEFDEEKAKNSCEDKNQKLDKTKKKCVKKGLLSRLFKK